jgi:5-methylcytosine-specific restriction endonuclease McrA
MRDWGAFRAKVHEEGRCRIGGALHGPPDAAHIIQRSRIPGDAAMDPLNCVPLCRDCHRDYDERRLDLLPALRPAEQAYAVQLVGLIAALERLTNRRWGPA